MRKKKTETKTCADCGIEYSIATKDECPKCHPTKVVLEPSVRRSTIPPVKCTKTMGIMLDDDR